MPEPRGPQTSLFSSILTGVLECHQKATLLRQYVCQLRTVKKIMVETIQAEEEERKMALASAETLFSPAQKSIEELKGAMNLEQFKR